MKTYLKAVRRATGKSQLDVAMELGVSLSTYQKYEQGQRKLTGDTLIKLARILNTTTDTILGTEFSEMEPEIITASERRVLEAFRSIKPEGQNVLLEMMEAYVFVSKVYDFDKI